MQEIHGVARRGFVRVVLAATALLMLSVGQTRAIGGPDTTGCYAFSDTIAPLDGNAPTYSFVDISGTGSSLLLSDDEVSSGISLGFDFTFYGITYSSVFISSNGFISFLPGQGDGCCDGEMIPRGPVPNGFVAGLWTDLYPPDGAIYFQTLGSAPSRQFVVQYQAVPRCCAFNAGTFEIILNEGSNEILVQYLNTQTGGGLDTAGIESDTGSGGVQWRYPFVALNHSAVRYFSVRDQMADTDGDGLTDCRDNCPNNPNLDQVDTDQDGIGDVCDACPAGDPDADNLCVADNCPIVFNPDQADADADGVGDVCDNCPLAPNTDQADGDFDGIGAACDPCTTCGVAAPCSELCVDQSTGVCAPAPFPDGVACLTSDPCRPAGQCAAGVCAAAPAPDGTTCFDVPPCSSGGVCMAGECESTGTLPDGSFCFDNSACTLNDHCVGGNCVGTPVVCPGSADQCHPGPTCDPQSGCNNPPEADGTTCDDGDRCTTDDSCKLGVCGGTRVEACHIDQFACYGGGGPSLRQSVTAADRFGGGQFDLGRSTASCHPATDGFPFEDQKTHLTCARVRPKGAPFGSRTLGVHNRLGDATLEVLRPYSLCLPSEEPGQPGAGGLDDYMCYRVRPARADKQSLTLSDQFESGAVKIFKARTLCVPTARSGNSIKDGKSNLLCYSVRDSNGNLSTPSITLTSALRNEILQLTHRRTVCLPTTIDPCAQITFTSSSGSYYCGGPEFEPEPQPPFSGAIYDAPTGGSKLEDLGAGCIYFGGGDSEYYPAAQSTAGGSFTLDADTCDGTDYPLTASAGSASGECTLGPSDRKVCLNEVTQTCETDADCPGALATSCQFAPRCFAGPPTPFRSQFNVCYQNPVSGDATGTVNPLTGELTVTTPSSVFVYLTFAEPPCPICVNHVCQGGSRNGLACAPSGSAANTSLDCPPFDNQFFIALGGQSSSNSTRPLTMSSTDGLFCPGQANPGAFGVPEARRIEETGLSAGNLFDLMPHPATLLNLSCIDSSGNEVVDEAADLPGPQANSIVGTLQMTQ